MLQPQSFDGRRKRKRAEKEGRARRKKK